MTQKDSDNMLAEHMKQIKKRKLKIHNSGKVWLDDIIISELDNGRLFATEVIFKGKYRNRFL
jgi:hypothetical protein